MLKHSLKTLATALQPSNVGIPTIRSALRYTASSHVIYGSVADPEQLMKPGNTKPWAPAGYTGSSPDTQQRVRRAIFYSAPFSKPTPVVIITMTLIAVPFACQASGPLEQRTEQEMFYSCPSLSAEAFFEAVSNQLEGLEGEGSPYVGNLESQLEQTIEVAQAVQASLCNCLGQLLVSCSL